MPGHIRDNIFTVFGKSRDQFDWADYLTTTKRDGHCLILCAAIT